MKSVKHSTLTWGHVDHRLTPDRASANTDGLDVVKQELHDVSHALQKLAGASEVAFDRSQGAALRLSILERELAGLSQTVYELQVKNLRVSLCLLA